ncbi:MAG: hypothetical protein ACUVXA_20375 [Candidatus Jordarchaeum sp.]|uniref:hypothetical protein n=1 Tax=Candidatus Jordarchaeum sp. TaxID=2823881 RepID=UPI0040494AF9
MIEDYFDEDVAYLLGLISARGVFRELRAKEIIIEFPFKGLMAVGVKKRFTQKDSIKVSLIEALGRVEELTD